MLTDRRTDGQTDRQTEANAIFLTFVGIINCDLIKIFLLRGVRVPNSAVITSELSKSSNFLLASVENIPVRPEIYQSRTGGPANLLSSVT